MTIFLCAVLMVLGVYWIFSGFHLILWGLVQFIRNILGV